MKELNDEIQLTISMMQGESDIYEGALTELQHHLNCLLEIKRNEIQKRLGGTTKPLTAKPLTEEELKAGGWWCDDISEECQIVFTEKGFKTQSPHWSSKDGYTRCYLLGAYIIREVEQHGAAQLKQIYRISNEFYWSEE